MDYVKGKARSIDVHVLFLKQRDIKGMNTSVWDFIMIPRNIIIVLSPTEITLQAYKWNLVLVACRDLIN